MRFKGFGGSTIEVKKSGMDGGYITRTIRPKTATQKANAAYSLAKRVANDRELKELNLVSPPTAVDNIGLFFFMNNASQGTGSNQVVGSSWRPSSFNCRMTITPASTPVNCFVRIILFLWKQGAPSSPPVATDILNAATVISDKSTANRYKSNILYDRVFPITPANVAIRHIKVKVKLRKYGLAAFDGGAVGKNRLYCMVLSDQGIGVNQPKFTINGSYFFKDS